MARPASDQTLVADIQRGLASLGFFHGAIDGNPGPETSRAIREFENFNRYKITGQVQPDLVDLLRQVAQGLSVAQVDLRSILAQVAQLALTGQEVYLLIDDADQLDDAALKTVLALAAGNGEGRPHVFLFAEPELLGRLEALAGGEECYHAIELQPYIEEETRDYLAQRLEGAGQGIEVLNEEQIEEIHLRSQGWPGAINQEARELLVEMELRAPLN